MLLVSARITNYRSIIDTGEFHAEKLKTILVGPNEAGKSAVLHALQQINPPEGVKGFDPLRDYPRSKYNDIKTGKVNPTQVTVVTATFALQDNDKKQVERDLHNCTYTIGRKLDNKFWHRLNGAPEIPTYKGLERDLKRLSAHLEERATAEPGKSKARPLSEIADKWTESTPISGDNAKNLKKWLDEVYPYVDEENDKEEDRHASLLKACSISEQQNAALTSLFNNRPTFVLYSNYFRVRPNLHLERFAARLKAGSLDDTLYDYGNSCLLKLLGFTASELSELGRDEPLQKDDQEALDAFRKKKDERGYALNAASIRLTEEIRKIWNPDDKRGEAAKLVLKADGQYLKAVVEDSLGVEIELDQRSEGLQWLVSFFIVFFAEAEDENANAILLLDEPGVSLHALKQREFRSTLTRLSESNQTIYTTHSPFLVGPDELDLVRVVEMPDRKVGTKVHTTITSGDSAALLPLQEALGYDLAQTLFGQRRNLIVEGLTDYWYVEAVSALLSDCGMGGLDTKISLVPAGNASKVVYYATILHAQNLKVAALLDSDAAGENAARQETLVHSLGQKRIMRTRDFYSGPVTTPEIEDLLRDTLIQVAKSELNIDVSAAAETQKARPLVDLLQATDPNFSKYRLAKAFLKWSRENDPSRLTASEREAWSKLIASANKVLA